MYLWGICWQHVVECCSIMTGLLRSIPYHYRSWNGALAWEGVFGHAWTDREGIEVYGWLLAVLAILSCPYMPDIVHHAFSSGCRGAGHRGLLSHLLIRAWTSLSVASP